nr:hypothetical protein [Tanacetum cinerariifolium]
MNLALPFTLSSVALTSGFLFYSINTILVIMWIQRISLTGFPAESVGSSNTDVLELPLLASSHYRNVSKQTIRVGSSNTDVLDSPCSLVLVTGTSQSRQHAYCLLVWLIGVTWVNFWDNNPELLLEDNKLDKKSFKDAIPQHAQEDPLCHQIFTEMDFRSFLIEGIDGEFHFEPKGGVDDGEGSSPSIRFVNNEAPVIDPEPQNSASPLQFAKNIGDSNDAPSEKDVGDEARNQKLGKSSKATRKRKQIAESSGRETRQKAQKVPPQASKDFGDPSDPLDVDSDPDFHEFPSTKELKDSADYHWVVAHMTHPSWKQLLKEIGLKKLYNIHDKAYIRQVILDNVLNREREKDKAYAELKMRLHDEYSRLVLEEKKWVDYEQTLAILRSKVEGLESKRERLKKSET